MIRKIGLVFLILMLSAGWIFAGGQQEQSGKKDSQGTVAVCLPSLDNPLMLGIGEKMREIFPDLKVDVASAEGDPNTQTSQIQNYTAMGVEMIVVMPVEAGAINDVLKDARAAGIKVFVNGSKLEEGSYDVMAAVNQYLVGQYTSFMAKKWIDTVYGKAAPGSVETLILTSSSGEDAVNRSKGLLSIREKYRKNKDGQYVNEKNEVVNESARVANPLYCPQLNVVSAVDADMFQAAQVATQNAFTSHPGIKLIITYTSDGAAGASQVIADAGYGQSELDKMAVFGCGLIGPESGLLIDAEAKGGVFRGATAFGGKDLPGDMAAIARTIYDGTNSIKDIWDPISIVYSIKGEVVFNQVPNTGAVQEF